jgi:oxygen-independent coproporphyrinogen III oxidase
MPVASHVLAERTVPRYTSYPTAPHFHAEVGPEIYAEWLARLPSAATLSLYLHVPFCVELCHYCGCHTRAVRRRDPIERYADTLAQEIDLVAGIAGGRRVLHLHWGGGTPSTLGERNLIALSDRLGKAFDLNAIREHAIELDPRHVTPALAGALAHSASIG